MALAMALTCQTGTSQRPGQEANLSVHGVCHAATIHQWLPPLRTYTLALPNTSRTSENVSSTNQPTRLTACIRHSTRKKKESLLCVVVVVVVVCRVSCVVCRVWLGSAPRLYTTMYRVPRYLLYALRLGALDGPDILEPPPFWSRPRAPWALLTSVSRYHYAPAIPRSSRSSRTSTQRRLIASWHVFCIPSPSLRIFKTDVVSPSSYVSLIASTLSSTLRWGYIHVHC